MKDWMKVILRAPEGEGTGGGGEEIAAPEDVLGAGVEVPPGETKTEATEQTPEQKAEAEAAAKAEAEAKAKAKAEADMTPEQKAEAEAKAAAEAKLNAVPGENEAYEFALPEGMELDTTLAEKAQPVLKELNLTQGQANKLATVLAEVRASEGEKIATEYVKMQNDYVKAAKADPEIGQTNWDTSTKQANAALQKFGTPALVAALREHGLQNHPEMIRFAARIGLHTADDVADPGTHVDTETVAPEERWYGKTTATKKN